MPEPLWRKESVSDFLERISKLSPKRVALLAAELNSNLEQLRRQSAEPIAIIGMGCRLPGGANDPDSFWRLLIEGRDGIGEVPADRWDAASYYDPNPDSPGKASTLWGGFVSGIDGFDPEFFGISPREAVGMDPQQRLLLEVAWEALEHAGQSPDELAGTRTGVFTGLCNSDYYTMSCGAGPDSLDAYTATGNAHSVAAGRISYVLGLRGPSVALDTSCSASLVAVHMACQSLRLGESNLALAGGVNVILNPDVTVALSRSRMMSSDGRCKAFDAAADGFVRSEGCGVVVLKRISDAQRHGDRILAVIRGTASNQDGRSSGLTAPNGPSQVALIEDALANSGLRPADIEFIEAHGTGTSLGDPVEARALADVFASGRPLDCPLQVGSVKTNIGHAESAAGIAGLIKVVLALHHERIPPSLHFHKLNPAIEWRSDIIRVTARESQWSRRRGERFAGVSSFGFSGTNAHVIVSDWQEDEPISNAVAHDGAESGTHLLSLSARTPEALLALARKYENVFAQHSDLNLADVAHTAGVGRSHFEYRLAVPASSTVEAKEWLTAFGRGEKGPNILSGRTARAGAPGVVFLFTGQGSQYPGMGLDLYETRPVFRRELDRCAEILKTRLAKPLLDVMFGGADGSSSHLLNETQYTQPALFALEYALAALWRSWGIEPAAVLGHSLGEYVAACVAGVFSVDDALPLVADRARLMQALPRNGAMAAIFASEDRVRAAIAPHANLVSIAAINSPRNTVISGEANAIRTILDRLQDEGVPGTELAVSHAFHSPLIDPMLDEFEACARRVSHKAPVIDLVLNETGRVLDRTSPLDPSYWRRHARGAVRFAESVAALCEGGKRVFLEVGPAPVLTGMARQCTGEADVVWLSSLRRDRAASSEMLSSLGALYTLGHNPDWRAVEGGSARRRLALPTYAFQRQRYWLTPSRERLSAGDRPAAGDAEPAAYPSSTTFERNGIEPASQTADTLSALGPKAGLGAALRASAPADQRRLLQAFIREQTVRVLALGASQPVDTGQSLSELGLDSLMALELRNALAVGVECALPATALFHYPSIDALTDYICNDLFRSDTVNMGAASRKPDIARVTAPAIDFVEGQL
jgi:acyl transferase domain-containing protein